MHYVDLKRSFVRIEKDSEANLDPGLATIWGHRIAGWLDWSELLTYRRVVLLAEALSGKTEEFRHQAEALVAQGKAAFFVRIEDLADDGFEAALEPSAVQAFERWRDSEEEEGWFFLDSVDEARLNHKSLDKALRRFVGEIDRGRETARVYMSCRVSDWNGREDREAIDRHLPVWARPIPQAPENDDAELLEPIFKGEPDTGAALTMKEPERKPKDPLLVVQIVPLNGEQRRLLAKAAGIDRPDAFVEEIERNGLDNLADRPGDLLDLADYWKTKGQFGSLVEVTEHGISCKLAEQDKFRPDNRDLSSDKARCGAERLAATLTLAKSFTLRAPGHDPDPTLAAGALDSAEILEEWTDAERNALTRRGVFAPSTYGRLRFHHRGTQEYLMACWLNRLLRQGCPRAAVWELLFVERYGIETLVPSLHATGAWLALDQPDIRDEIIRREPLLLLRHGDPRSLPLQAKERLLFNYATRHAGGEISDHALDDQALWMFATPDLADAIHKGWDINNREAFRFDLLRLIREGEISACAHLARSAALDESSGDSLRIVAVQALDACGDAKSLVQAAQWLKDASGHVNARLSSSLAKILFPLYLTVDNFLYLIENSSAAPRSLEEFGYVIGDLWKACRDSATRKRLLAELAELCLSPPFRSAYSRISSRYHDLAKHLAPVAREAVLGLRDTEASEGLVRSLMAVERADRQMSPAQEEAPLADLVSENLHLRQMLFWADFEEMRQNTDRGEDFPVWSWQVLSLLNNSLWKLGPNDLNWLFEDLAGRPLEAEKRFVLSAIADILRDTGSLDAEVSRLRTMVSGWGELERELEVRLAPPKEDEEMRQFRLEQERHQRADYEKESKAKESWVQFREELKIDPSVLQDPTGAWRLIKMTCWLCGRTKKGYEEATLQWRLLEEPFDRTVAEAYRDGMKALWRVTPPERPKKVNGLHWKYTTILSFSGVGIEATEDPDWAQRLNEDEAKRAAQHGCLSERGYPNWIDELIDRHQSIVLPILQRALQSEWTGQHGDLSDLFSHYSNIEKAIQPPVQRIMFKTIAGKGPKALEMLNRGLRTLQRLDLSDAQRRRATALARNRLREAQSGGEDERVRCYFAMLFIFDADGAARELADWLDSAPPTSRDTRAEGSLGALFEGRSGLAAGVPDRASVLSLEALVRLAYRYVRPEDDRVHEGFYTPNARDEAEEARDILLKALIDRPGPDAYQAMQTLAGDQESVARAIRFKELARRKAEQDAEPPAWTPTEVLTFERDRIAPAKTGETLLCVIMDVLSDIQASFRRDDATSQDILRHAETEDEVQKWLAEQLSFRSQGRFHVHREVQVARGNKPDIIISSTAAGVEVAVEVKHSKSWTVRHLERALTKQLAEDYLKPASRRCGVLVVSHHRQRTWRDPDTRATLYFQDVIKRLQALATNVVRNHFGHVEVRTFGIDASPN